MLRNSISILAVVSTSAGLVACGGDESIGTSVTVTPTPTPAPVPTPTPGSTVDAGIDQIVAPGTTVTLQGFETNAALTWTQTQGPDVTLSDPTSARPEFTAPTVSESTTLAFEVSDGSISDTVFIEVFVAPDQNDSTALGDFTGNEEWACTQAPIAANTAAFTVNGGITTVTGNAVPRHATGTFPNAGNPNAISAQNRTYTFTNTPVNTGTITEMAEFGITLDGVVLERDTAESFQNAGVWNYEAITPAIADGTTSNIVNAWLGTDCNNGHVQPTGNYHYHGMMELLLNLLGENEGVSDMVLGGYAADGFPFYLRYGYNDAGDPVSGLKVMTADWALRAGTRGSGPGGAFDGEFREDWVFVAGPGDLDECGGRFGPTPEFPSGIYHYFITDDYPYIPRCVRGTPDGSFRRR